MPPLKVAPLRVRPVRAPKAKSNPLTKGEKRALGVAALIGVAGAGVIYLSTLGVPPASAGGRSHVATGTVATQNVGENPPDTVSGQQVPQSTGPSAYSRLPPGINPTARTPYAPAFGGTAGAGSLETWGPYVKPPSPSLMPTLPQLKEIGLPGHGVWPAIGINVTPRQYGWWGPRTGSGIVSPRAPVASYGAGGGGTGQRYYQSGKTYAAPAVPSRVGDYGSQFGNIGGNNMQVALPVIGSRRLYARPKVYTVMDNVTMTGPGPRVVQYGAGGAGLAFPVIPSRRLYARHRAYTITDNVTMTGRGPRVLQGGAGGGGIAMPVIGSRPLFARGQVYSIMDNVTMTGPGPRVRQYGAGGCSTCRGRAVPAIAFPAIAAPGRGGTIRSDRYPTGDYGDDTGGWTYRRQRVTMV